jgi:hypothetical protein
MVHVAEYNGEVVRTAGADDALGIGATVYLGEYRSAAVSWL